MKKTKPTFYKQNCSGMEIGSWKKNYLLELTWLSTNIVQKGLRIEATSMLMNRKYIGMTKNICLKPHLLVPAEMKIYVLVLVWKIPRTQIQKPTKNELIYLLHFFIQDKVKTISILINKGILGINSINCQNISNKITL